MGDYRNQIRRFREKKRMSQRQLAAAVGTSQQQIQRYETGSPVKLAVAVSLANSLETTLEKLFPESKRAVDQLKKNARQESHADSDEVDRDLLRAGIEVDPCEWTARVLVRGGNPNRPMLYPINVSDKNRVRHYLNWGYEGSVEAKQADEDATFFVFDAGDRSVAVNMEHLVFWQNCWDPPSYMHLSADDPDKENAQGERNEEFACAIKVYLAGIREPMTLDVEPDDDEPEEADCDEGQFRNLLITLDSRPEKDSYVSITDVDGEVAFFRVRDIVVLEIAKDVTEPEPFEAAEENDHELSEVGVEPRS